MFRLFASVLAAVGVVNAATHDIAVGKGASLAFAPNTLTAAVGDTLNFHFYSGSGGHSVVSGSFSSPCQPATNAFFSGYIKGDSTGDMTFVVNVTSTDPIWFYCSLGPHCMDGMVGVVNPLSGQKVSDYVNAASGAKASAPATLQGGVLTTMSAGSGSGSGSGSASSTSSVTSMSSSMTSMSGSSMSTASGANAQTTMPTSTGTAASSATTSKSSSMSTGVAATTTPSGAGKSKDLSVVLGLSVVMGGLVALMA